MCGLAGEVRVGELADVESVARMGATMINRGPDGNGVWASGPLALSFRRLKIIDLSAELRRIYEVFKVQMLPFVEALPTRKNPKGDLGDDIRGTLIPDGASQDGRASEGAPPNQSSGPPHGIVEKN